MATSQSLAVRADAILKKDVLGNRSARALAPSYVPKAEVVQVFVCPDSLSGAVRQVDTVDENGVKVPGRVIMSPGDYSKAIAELGLAYYCCITREMLEQNSRRGSWVTTMIEAVFPGLLTRLPGTGKALKLTAVRLTDYEAACMQALIVPAEGKLVEDIGFASQAEFDSRYFNEAEIVGAVALYIFTIGKAASDANITAFTTNRPRAMAGKQGMVLIEGGLLTETLGPQAAQLNQFAGWFNMHPAARKAFVQEVISWTGADCGLRQEIVATQVKLWHGSGMTHIGLIKALLVNYAALIERIPELKQEVDSFLAEYAEVTSASSSVGGIGYNKVINGDRYEVLHSSKYPELFKLARDVAGRSEARFNKYAQQTSTSAHIGALETLYEAEFGRPMAARRKEDAADL